MIILGEATTILTLGAPFGRGRKEAFIFTRQAFEPLDTYRRKKAHCISTMGLIGL